ncbi:MAG: alpha/beta fold hydrolase [Acidimicrobiales bacterium]|jgi:pimeloyl-ACP methyl ester carboxylesterase
MAPLRARVAALSKRARSLAVALAAVTCFGGALAAPAAASAGTPAPPTTAVDGTDASVTGALASFYRPPDPLPYAPAGSVIRTQQIPAGSGLPSGTRAYRILYHSTSGSGGDLAESGIAVVPGGTPPPGGFPVVSWAHGTTGVASGCAPSLEGTATLPDLAGLIHDRDIVVATDYRGLGAPGLHPYLVGDSEGEDVLDAARAARALVGSDASDDVVILGYSQGGQAALFAGEIAPSYAPDLYVAGVAAVAPVTSVLELAPSGDLPPPSGQSAFTAMVLFAWARHYRTFGLRTVLTPAGLADLGAVSSSCVDGVASLYDAVPPAHFFLPGWEQVPAVQAANRANRPGGTPTSAPILVVQGTADEVVPFGETTEFIKQSLCRSQYDDVEYVTDQGAGHSQVMGISSGLIERWIQDRFGGGPTIDSCTRPGLGLSRTT